MMHMKKQFVAYKRYDQKNENDTANLNVVPKNKLINHYKAVWYIDDLKTDHSTTETDNFTTYEGYLITIEELEEALGKTKNKKTKGQARLNVYWYL